MQCELRLIPITGWFSRADGRPMIRLANPNPPAAATTTDYDVWAADALSGQIYKFDPSMPVTPLYGFW